MKTNKKTNKAVKTDVAAENVERFVCVYEDDDRHGNTWDVALIRTRAELNEDFAKDGTRCYKEIYKLGTKVNVKTEIIG